MLYFGISQKFNQECVNVNSSGGFEIAFKINTQFKQFTDPLFFYAKIDHLLNGNFENPTTDNVP